jgi:ATP-binding cassette subfamily B protein
MGTHQQLLAQRGIYFKLYQLQYKDQEMNVGGVERALSSANGDGFKEPEVTAKADD